MGGWARNKPERKPQSGRGLVGVWLADMPSGKPFIPRRRIKGLPGLTGTDPDYAPGGGTWTPVERGKRDGS
jgi:hypothetical protein